jgi:hypothetical protein
MFSVYTHAHLQLFEHTQHDYDGSENITSCTSTYRDECDAGKISTTIFINGPSVYRRACVCCRKVYSKAHGRADSTEGGE